MFGDLASVTQDLLHYFDTRGSRRDKTLITLHIDLTAKKQSSSEMLKTRYRPRPRVGLEPRASGFADRHGDTLAVEPSRPC